MVATSRQRRRRQLESESGPGRRGGPLMRTAQPALACRVAQRPGLGEGGFTLVELMIAALITAIVMGGAVALATQIQRGYSTQLEDAAVEQEARYALDWIARDLRSAGSFPYEIIPTPQGILPDGDDSIRIQADVNPPDGVLDNPGENITIALDTVNSVICRGAIETPRCASITREDPNAAEPAAVAMTDAIFTGLSFTYLNAKREVMVPVVPELVAYIRVQVDAVSRARNPITTSRLSTEVRLRTR